MVWVCKIMSIKNRIKLLQKIAQTGRVNTPPTVSGDPTAANVTSLFPQFTIGWGSNNSIYIQGIINVLNYSIYALSNGALDFNKLRTQNFSFDDSKFPDPILRAIINLTHAVYSKILTHGGQTFKAALTAEEKKDIIDLLKQNVSTSAIPDGGINNYLNSKIGGSLKSTLNNYLSNIK
jgi:hypothetical protein